MDQLQKAQIYFKMLQTTSNRLKLYQTNRYVWHGLAQLEAQQRDVVDDNCEMLQHFLVASHCASLLSPMATTG